MLTNAVEVRAGFAKVRSITTIYTNLITLISVISSLLSLAKKLC